jgi:hypothetical protein
MTETVCFRCDWQGRARSSRCPSCGTPLYRPDGADGARGPDAVIEDDEAHLGEDPMRRSAPRGAAIAIAVLLALVTVIAVDVIASGPSPAGSATARRESPGAGTLVYLARGHGRARLWVVDLAAGVARPGPTVPRRTSELVDVSGAASGWVGVERHTDRRQVAVSVLPGVAPDAEAVGLGHGDLVAWGPGGASLVFARNGRRAPAGCAPVRINLVTVLTEKVEWALDDPGFCGPILSLSRSAAATYFTAASGDRLSVYLTGSVGVPHLMFEGMRVISARPPSAFLLAPHSPLTSRGDPSSGIGTLLGWKGIGGPVTVGDGQDLLVIERILAWTADGGRVALVGSVGARSGVFVLDAGSGSGNRVPRFVMPADPGLDATFDAAGRLYLSAGGRVSVARDGSLEGLPLPAGAPAPSGPIVWIP